MVWSPRSFLRQAEAGSARVAKATPNSLTLKWRTEIGSTMTMMEIHLLPFMVLVLDLKQISSAKDQYTEK